MSSSPEQSPEEASGRIGDGNASDSDDDYSTASEDSLPVLEEYGHKYHGSGRVFFPLDDYENERLNLQHRLYKLVLHGELHTAKLRLSSSLSPSSSAHDRFQILDAGAGNGCWAIEMGQKYPSATIRGIDLTAALLPEKMPSNVVFEIADLATSDGWPAHRTYDYIFVRNLIGGGVRDWQGFLARAYQQLRPGGQIEFADFRPRFYDIDPNMADLPDGLTPDSGPATRRFHQILMDVCLKLNVDLDPVAKVPGWYSEIGATEIQVQRDFVPLTEWGDDAEMRRKGEAARRVMDNAMELCTLRMLCKAGLEETAAREMLDAATKESRDPSLRALMEVNFVTAKKPS